MSSRFFSGLAILASFPCGLRPAACEGEPMQHDFLAELSVAGAPPDRIDVFRRLRSGLGWHARCDAPPGAEGLGEGCQFGARRWSWRRLPAQSLGDVERLPRIRLAVL